MQLLGETLPDLFDRESRIHCTHLSAFAPACTLTGKHVGRGSPFPGIANSQVSLSLDHRTRFRRFQGVARQGAAPSRTEGSLTDGRGATWLRSQPWVKGVGGSGEGKGSKSRGVHHALFLTQLELTRARRLLRWPYEAVVLARPRPGG